MKILLVEDDDAIAAPLTEYLCRNGVPIVKRCALLSQARACRAEEWDAIVLDWMLPDGAGIEWLRALRASGARTPVVMLTARVELSDRVLGLELGANDYVLKPFEPRELLARISAHVRTARELRAGAEERLCVAGIMLDKGARQAFLEGVVVELTPMEFDLLAFFLQNPGKALARETLLYKVWGLRAPSTRTVDVHVAQLRQKLGHWRFETVHRIGYRFRPAGEGGGG